MDKYRKSVSKGKDEYLKALDAINWFGFGQNDRKAIEQHLAELEANGNHDYFVFSLTHLDFDAEGFESGEDYQHILSEIEKTSGLKITSSTFEFSDEWTEMSVTVTTQDKTYQTEFEELFGWFDTDFIDNFINEEILPGENIEGKFYFLPALDQTMQLVFIAPKVYDQAIEKGIIPGNLEYFME